MSEETCKNCKYLGAVFRGEYGPCRRYPPIMDKAFAKMDGNPRGFNESSAYWVFPIVAPDDYCGEHKPR